MSSKRVMIKKVHIDDNQPNFVTKPVAAIKFEKCMNLIGVVDLDQKLK